MYAQLSNWYDTWIVKGWYRTWTIWAAAAALVGPELLQIAMANWDLFFDLVPAVYLSADAKLSLQKWLIVLIAVVRVIKQVKLPQPVEPKEV